MFVDLEESGSKESGWNFWLGDRFTRVTGLPVEYVNDKSRFLPILLLTYSTGKRITQDPLCFLKPYKLHIKMKYIRFY
jgi:hypothetical protein